MKVLNANRPEKQGITSYMISKKGEGKQSYHKVMFTKIGTGDDRLRGLTEEGLWALTDTQVEQDEEQESGQKKRRYIQKI